MRVVASGAIAVFDLLVGALLFVYLVGMTCIAQLLLVLFFHRRKFVVPGLFVACKAYPDSHWTVDKLVLALVGMAFIGNARFPVLSAGRFMHS